MVERKKYTSQNCLGIDFGTKRYGLALGQTYTYDVRPLKILKADNGIIKNYILDRIIITYNIKNIILGFTDCNGYITQMIMSLYSLLKARYYHICVYLMDEQYTSRGVKCNIFEENYLDDAESACHIIYRWFLSMNIYES